jgi:hypothetical protein
MTRDTVMEETPARAATSTIVAPRAGRSGLAMPTPFAFNKAKAPI